jgi:hypothetical protein
MQFAETCRYSYKQIIHQVNARGGFQIGSQTLDEGDVPRLGTQDAQEGGRVHRPGADLCLVGLPQDSAALGPEGLQFEDNGLESVFHL